MTEGGELKQNTNINFLLEEYGIMVNNGEWVTKSCSTNYCVGVLQMWWLVQFTISIFTPRKLWFPMEWSTGIYLCLTLGVCRATIKCCFCFKEKSIERLVRLCLDSPIKKGALSSKFKCLLETSFECQCCFLRSLSFVYPFGATLTVQKPAVTVLSSGSTSTPVNRPVCAFCHSKASHVN